MKNQTFKKFVSLFLTLVMFSGFVGLTAFAEESGDLREAQEPAVSAPADGENEPPAPPGEDPVEDPEDTNNPDAPQDPADPNASPDPQNSGDLGDADEDENIDSEDSIDETKDKNDAEIGLVYRTLSASLSDILVEVRGNLPEDVVLHVLEVPVASVADQLDLSDDSEAILALDIELRQGGEKYEIPESVEVSITGIDLSDADTVEAHHIPDSGNIDVVQPLRTDADSIVFSADGFSIWVVAAKPTALDDSKQNVIKKYHNGILTAKIYLLYDNVVPDDINHGFPVEQFGPQGNDTPYFTVKIDMKQLLKDPSITVQWKGNSWYISQNTTGTTYGYQAIWEKILASMTEGSGLFAQFNPATYYGYVLKDEGTPHIDGILDINLPYYRTELYIDGVWKAALEAQTAHTKTDVLNKFQTLLSADAINWETQTFTKGGTTYYFKLNDSSRNPSGFSGEAQNYTKMTDVNIWVAHQYIDIIPDETGDGTGAGTVTITGTKKWEHGSNANKPTVNDLTLTLYKKLKTETEWKEVDATPTWSGNNYTFTVAYESHATKYKVVETRVPDNYTSYPSSTAVKDSSTAFDTGTKESNNNDTSFDAGSANFIVVKLTEGKFLIWTSRELTANEKTEAISKATNQSEINQIASGNTTFMSGNGATHTNGNKGTATFTHTNGQTTISFSKTNVWAMFFCGTMTTTASAEKNIKNTYVPPTTSVSGTKSWVDKENQPITTGLPASITVSLYKTGKSEPIDTNTVQAGSDGKWTYTFTNLPTHDNGTPITYSVKETAITVDGTTIPADANGRFIVYGNETNSDNEKNVIGVWVPSKGTGDYDITNTYTPAEHDGSGSFEIKKVDATDNTELNGAEFTLTPTNPVGDPITKTTGEDGTTGYATFSDLPLGTYTLTETQAPDGYAENTTEWTVTVTADGAILLNVTSNGNIFTNFWKWVVKVVAGEQEQTLVDGVLTVTNTRITGTATVHDSITIEKKDGAGQLIKSDSATFTIYEGMTAIGSVATTNGTATVSTDLSMFTDKLPTADGQSKTFTMKETKAPDLYDGVDTEWAITVTATVSDPTLTLVGEVYKFVTTTTYAMAITGVNGGVLTVTNTRQTGTLKLTKEIAGVLNKSNFSAGAFTFTITNTNDNTTQEVKLPQTVEGGTGLVWSIDITDLPTGNYTVSETGTPTLEDGYGLEISYTYPTGATATVTKGGQVAVTVTNKYTYTPGNKTLTATKFWNDNDNVFGLRPASVTFALFGKDNVQIGEPQKVVLTTADVNMFKAEFPYDSHQNDEGDLYVKEIGYTDLNNTYHPFGEGLTAVPGYKAPFDQAGSTNTIVNELNTTTLTIEKEFAGSTVSANPTFTITGENLGYETVISYYNFTDSPLTYIVLPVDTYTVTESNADVGGYTRTTKWAVQGLTPQRYAFVNSDELEFTDGMVATIDLQQEQNNVLFVNTYSPIYYPPGSPEPSDPPETEIPDTDPPLDPSPDTSPEPSEDPGIDIPEESGPLGPGPDTEIPDAETPVDAAPQTGDNSRAVPFAILSLLSAFGIAALGFLGRKKKHN